ncbi:hypothetical protein [Sulfobacillus sp. hq2]|uniref:hypothetical protein n=1 Tax=Sulfobacillus TaxID=28033 RepID=UPI000CD2447C|nr:hypothetical protein [Sulfobacillus sp. hq2]POB10209.1 hypothetical protein CO251_11175 [Sulfobacillus sp. hq2]
MSSSKRAPELKSVADSLSGLPATEAAALRMALQEILTKTDGTSADFEARLGLIQRRLLAAGTKGSVESPPEQPAD